MVVFSCDLFTMIQSVSVLIVKKVFKDLFDINTEVCKDSVKRRVALTTPLESNRIEYI